MVGIDGHTPGLHYRSIPIVANGQLYVSDRAHRMFVMKKVRLMGIELQPLGLRLLSCRGASWERR